MSGEKHLLVVDDEKMIREWCRRVLVKQGYTIDTAENGFEALKKLEQQQYDLCLVDNNMPLMTGLEFLKAVKRDYPGVNVMMMTGYGTIEIAITAMKAGADEFILKPFGADYLTYSVNKCFEKISLSHENTELRRINEKLREFHAVTDKFITITSHELRTPITHLKGVVEIFNAADSSTMTAQERNKYWNILCSAVTHLEEIVNNMYFIAQNDYHGCLLDIQKLNVNELVEELTFVYEPMIKKRSHQLQINLASNLPLILADRVKIRKLITAVIDNAVKFTADGGELVIETVYKVPNIHILISDNGIGIPSEEQGKIFNQFYEVQSASQHKSDKNSFLAGGLGLGLSIAKSIVEAHNGVIKVTSEPGNGSCFEIILPGSSHQPVLAENATNILAN